MSKVSEIREVLMQNRNIIATEQVTTMSYTTSIDGVGRTQTVSFSLIPKYSRGRDSDLWHFQQSIVESLPVELLSEPPVKSRSYGKAYFRENVGTMIERRSRLIVIDDPSLSLSDDFVGNTWERNFDPVVTDLYRIITLGFYPMSYLYMMVTGVENENRNESWLHKPSEKHLEEMRAGLRHR